MEETTPRVTPLGQIKARGRYRVPREAVRAFERWSKRMSTPVKKPYIDGRVARILQEQGFSIDEDPRNLYDPAKLWERLAQYGEPDPRVWDEDIEFGFNVALKLFGHRGQDYLQVMTDAEELKKALQLSKSAGFPLFGTKKDRFEFALSRAEKILEGKIAPAPCVAYARTQAGGKTRLVWGYPLEMTIIEARFARPLIEKFMLIPTTMVAGYYKMEMGTRIVFSLREKRSRNFTTYALDFSHFDSSVPKKFIQRAFDILKTWFSRDDLDRWGWNAIVNYFIHTPIVMPDQKMYVGKDHGVPSGSYFTQLIDSIVNTALIFAIAHHFGQDIFWMDVFVLGDDSLFTFRKPIPLEDIAQFVARYGFSLNVEKSRINELHFLGAYWDRALPSRDVQELVNMISQPERPRDYKKLGDIQEAVRQVFLSYAAAYIEGWRLYPKRWGPWMYLEMLGTKATGFGLSGSDKWRWQYILPEQAKHPWNPLWFRILM